MSTSITRRDLFSGTAGVGAAALLGPGELQARTADLATVTGAGGPLQSTLNVNGREHRVTHDVRTTLLDALREHMALTGTKKGCDHGQCGACTVHLDGKTALSCLTLAVAVQGRKVITVEGLGKADALHPMQQAFIDCDAFQCGYCTPGQLMSAVACVKEGQSNDAAVIREYMSGNLCRCAAYPNIVKAIEMARGPMGGK